MTGSKALRDTSWCCLLQLQVVMDTSCTTHQGIAIQRLLDSTTARLNHVKVKQVYHRPLCVAACDVVKGFADIIISDLSCLTNRQRCPVVLSPQAAPVENRHGTYLLQRRKLCPKQSSDYKQPCSQRSLTSSRMSRRRCSQNLPDPNHRMKICLATSSNLCS